MEEKEEMLMTREELLAMQEASLESCDPDSLTDISTVSVDRSQPVPRRITELIEAVGNPYLFKVGEVVVKVTFNSGGKRFSDAVSDALCAC